MFVFTFYVSYEFVMKKVLEVLEFMSDATTVPILLDADTGYGNFNNARILVRKLEQRGVAGACIEDKLFPKTNSLLGNSEAKPLASIEEFTAKIKAMKDAQRDPDFVVVARSSFTKQYYIFDSFYYFAFFKEASLIRSSFYLHDFCYMIAMI